MTMRISEIIAGQSNQVYDAGYVTNPTVRTIPATTASRQVTYGITVTSTVGGGTATTTTTPFTAGSIPLITSYAVAKGVITDNIFYPRLELIATSDSGPMTMTVTQSIFNL